MKMTSSDTHFSVLLLLQRSNHEFFIFVITECICATGGTLSPNSSAGRPATDRAFSADSFPDKHPSLFFVCHTLAHSTISNCPSPVFARFAGCAMCPLGLWSVPCWGFDTFFSSSPRTGSISQRRCGNAVYSAQAVLFHRQIFLCPTLFTFLLKGIFFYSTAAQHHLKAQIKIHQNSLWLFILRYIQSRHGSVEKTSFNAAIRQSVHSRIISRFKTLIEYSKFKCNRFSAMVSLQKWH